MNNIQCTEKELKERKIKAILSLMYDTFKNHESVSYWHCIGDRDININS